MFQQCTSCTDGKDPKDVVEQELLQYSRERSLQVTENPLQWWKDNEKRYFVLSHLAKKYLCIPATSVPSECLFSTAENIITAKRSCLDPDNVNMLCFLHDNLP